MTTYDPLQLVGTLLDHKYQVENLVGQGGFGLVYRAIDIKLEKPVAIKCLKVPWAIEPKIRSAFLAKFKEEAQILFSLSEQTLGVVRSLTAGDVVAPSGIWAPYFVLQWLDGESLEDLLTRRREQGNKGRPLSEVIQWLDGPAQALTVAHANNIAHRDIKPANLMVMRQDGRVVTGPPGVPTIKILDFGIAKVMDQNVPGGGKHASTLVVYSPRYAAPEQVNPAMAGLTGFHSDVYSFALVAIELLTDRQAVETNGLMEILNPNVRPTQRTKGLQVGDEVEAVFARAFRVNPEERYQTIGEFWTALVNAARADSLRPGETVELERRRDAERRLAPRQVSGLTTGVTAIAVGDYHTCALTSAGGVLCWGFNSKGQLGDNSTTNRHVPTPVKGFP